MKAFHKIRYAIDPFYRSKHEIALKKLVELVPEENKEYVTKQILPFSKGMPLSLLKEILKISYRMREDQAFIISDNKK